MKNGKNKHTKDRTGCLQSYVQLEKYLSGTNLSSTQLELIKIRASQINGCAYCIDMHTKEALKNGESAKRIFLLNAWKETALFTEEEKLVLAMTEEITLIHQNGLSEQIYHKAEKLFGQTNVAQIIMAIAAINSWNRIAISTRLPING